MPNQPFENIYRSHKDIVLNNFLGGIAWGLGATVGLAIILTILGFILRAINVVPIIGNFATQINHYIQAHP
jgi:hypothetical protein